MGTAKGRRAHKTEVLDRLYTSEYMLYTNLRYTSNASEEGINHKNEIATTNRLQPDLTPLQHFPISLLEGHILITLQPVQFILGVDS